MQFNKYTHTHTHTHKHHHSSPPDRLRRGSKLVHPGVGEVEQPAEAGLGHVPHLDAENILPQKPQHGESVRVQPAVKNGLGHLRGVGRHEQEGRLEVGVGSPNDAWRGRGGGGEEDNRNTVESTEARDKSK